MFLILAVTSKVPELPCRTRNRHRRLPCSSGVYPATDLGTAVSWGCKVRRRSRQRYLSIAVPVDDGLRGLEVAVKTVSTAGIAVKVSPAFSRQRLQSPTASHLKCLEFHPVIIHRLPVVRDMLLLLLLLILLLLTRTASNYRFSSSSIAGRSILSPHLHQDPHPVQHRRECIVSYHHHSDTSELLLSIPSDACQNL